MNLTFESDFDYEQVKIEFRSAYIDVSNGIPKNYSSCKYSTKTFVNLDNIIQHVHKIYDDNKDHIKLPITIFACYLKDFQENLDEFIRNLVNVTFQAPYQDKTFLTLAQTILKHFKFMQWCSSTLRDLNKGLRRFEVHNPLYDSMADLLNTAQQLFYLKLKNCNGGNYTTQLNAFLNEMVQ